MARTHLQTLADAGLVRVGRRKHPGGGRPAKVYAAVDEPAGAQVDAGVRTVALDQGLVVRLLAALLDGPGGDVRTPPGPARTALAARGYAVAQAEGRRLVTGTERQGDAGRRAFAQAADGALRALALLTPGVRALRSGTDWVDVAGLRPAFLQLAAVKPDLADALERGLLAGALAGAGAPATVAEAGTLPSGEPVWRARPAPATGIRTQVETAVTVDARGQQREAGVVRAMRAVTRLRPGDVIEVLAEGPGTPAAFARWADRAGHQLLGVERAADGTGRPAIRMLIRKGAAG